jgi:DEAD/DEAH box helicase domain-containing protein
LSQESNTVFLDIETQRLAHDVGGWRNVSLLGMAAAVTYSSREAIFRHYTERQSNDLVRELQSADLIVGFNVLRFDYAVLRPYTNVDLQRLPTVDMLQDIYHKLGFRVSLDSLASATLGTSKSANGIQAVRWYREGRIQDVLAYCEKDVEVTRDLYEFGRMHRYLQFRDKRWRLRKVAVNW